MPTVDASDVMAMARFLGLPPEAGGDTAGPVPEAQNDQALGSAEALAAVACAQAEAEEAREELRELRRKTAAHRWRQRDEFSRASARRAVLMEARCAASAAAESQHLQMVRREAESEIAQVVGSVAQELAAKQLQNCRIQAEAKRQREDDRRRYRGMIATETRRAVSALTNAAAQEVERARREIFETAAVAPAGS